MMKMKNLSFSLLFLSFAFILCKAAWIGEKSSCIEEVQNSFIITKDFILPRPICSNLNQATTRLHWYGQQSFYDLSIEEEEEQQQHHQINHEVEQSSLPPLPEKKLIHLWKAKGGVEEENIAGNKKVQNDSIYAFLAWERLDLSPFMIYPTVNGTRWSDRILHSIETASGMENPLAHSDHASQKTFNKHPATQHSIKIVEMEKTYAIIRLSSLNQLLKLSSQLPIDTRMTRLNAIEIDQDSLDHNPFDDQRNVTLPQPKFIPPLHSLLFSETLSIPRLREDARILTGEDETGQMIPINELDDSLVISSNQHWHSRHSSTQEARLAGAWLRINLANSISPLGGNCFEWSYDDSFSPNIVCEIPASKESRKHQESEEEGMIIISSHYDSRGTFGSTRAPGGDDDGSGTTMLLAIARHIGKHNISFKRKVRLIAFSGEEQGLVGSKAYAEYLRKSKNIQTKKHHNKNDSENVYFMLQADMLGYRKPGEPLQVAFPDKLSTKAATDYVISIGKLYVPELQTGYTPACCSDHQSFWEQGFTSTWVFERRGPIADPCYHQSCDLIDRKGYDFQQIQSITKLVLATLLDIGGGIDWPY